MLRLALKTLHRSQINLNVSIQRTAVANFYSAKKENIFIMGSPGSGKTTVAQLVGKMLGMPVIDIDNDYLEKHWNTTVAKKLAELGNESFLQAEGEALMKFNAEKSVVSLTGSNPLHAAAMSHIRPAGVVVFLDVPITDIVQRLHNMQVDRIVGMQNNASLEDVLQYRQAFYEKNFDVRILAESGDTVTKIAEKIVSAVNLYKNSSFYTSTRDGSQTKAASSFSHVIHSGLAADGGLFVPEFSLPQLGLEEWRRLVNCSYAQRATLILERILHPSDVDHSLLASMANKAYSSANFESSGGSTVPVSHLYNNLHLVEQFHGPTASFKDLALQMFPHFFQHSDCSTSGSKPIKHLIVVATSGDTGSAALAGFKDTPNVKVLVAYPENGISLVQKKQMTTLEAGNVKVLGVKGTFDTCQNAAKQILNDQALRDNLHKDFGYKLSSANSINWGRLLPQIVSHASSYLEMVRQGRVLLGDEVDVTIPTGNFGNLLSLYYAQQMGIPYKRIICASNENNVLATFINTGKYIVGGRTLTPTVSPSMDILTSSNVERYLYHLTDGNGALVAAWMQALQATGRFEVSPSLLQAIQSELSADWCNEGYCLRLIKTVFEKTGRIIDTHTAVALAVSRHFNRDERPMLVVSTAHYSKFPSVIAEALKLPGMTSTTDPRKALEALVLIDKKAQPHTRVMECLAKPCVHDKVIDGSVDAFKREVVEFARQ